MRTQQHLFSLLALALSVSLAACGGGSDSGQRVDPNYLAKYQGAWLEQCAVPIEFSAGVFGPASKREKLAFSAPDSTGKVLLARTVDFFDSTLSCSDTTTHPYASIEAAPANEASFDRVQVSAAAFGSTKFDVLKVTQPASTVSASGTGIASGIVGGIAVWRITFSDGKTIDQDKSLPAESGELALLLSTVNGVPNSELTVGGAPQRFLKFAP